MKTLILFLSLIYSSAFWQESKQLIIIEQKVQVKGYTSLGKFNCGFQKVGQADTLNINSSQSQKIIQFQIPVKNFSCGNFLLNSDFRSTLKADQYPYAYVSVKNLREKSGRVFCHLTVDLVGKKLDFPDLMLEKVSNGLSGKLILNFQMLDLSPPSKMGGLVKVEDQLDLELLLGT
ncbi:hypothetical protein [Algoriphagus mannitolivorans]|uniref:hypothetical protein n=1 Tax=Algoriphagus mannitolivorans TaxID=226504 RepID=UPI000402B51A|nr:hypothetical protein [Algoriphagus mannitolivorans]